MYFIITYERPDKLILRIKTEMEISRWFETNVIDEINEIDIIIELRCDARTNTELKAK